MVDENVAKPRLTRFEDLRLVVRELKTLGISGQQIYQRITEVGPVDLDMLNEVLRADKLMA